MIASTSPATQRRVQKLLIAVVLGAVLGIVASWQWTTRDWSPEARDVMSWYSRARIAQAIGIDPGLARVAGHEIDPKAVLSYVRRSNQERLFEQAFRDTYFIGPAVGAAALVLLLLGVTAIVDRRKS